MTAVVIILHVRDGERVSSAIAREAARLHVASEALLAMTVAELRMLRARVAAGEMLDSRVAVEGSRAVLAAVRGANAC